MAGVLDATITCVDGDPNYAGVETFKVESYEYSVVRDITTYNIKIFKALSQLLGGIQLPNLALDFGTSIELFNLKCTIANEVAVGGDALPADPMEKRMMELSRFVRIKCFNAGECYLRIGTYVTGDGSRAGVDDPDKGIEGKPTKILFKYNSAEGKLTFTLEFKVCMDLEVV